MNVIPDKVKKNVCKRSYKLLLLDYGQGLCNIVRIKFSDKLSGYDLSTKYFTTNELA